MYRLDINIRLGLGALIGEAFQGHLQTETVQGRPTLEGLHYPTNVTLGKCIPSVSCVIKCNVKAYIGSTIEESLDS